MSFVSFIKIFIYNKFQIEDDLATYVGAGSKVKDMTAVNTVSIIITLFKLLFMWVGIIFFFVSIDISNVILHSCGYNLQNIQTSITVSKIIFNKAFRHVEILYAVVFL